MKCPKCNKQNPDSGKFCGYCGATLVHESQPQKTFSNRNVLQSLPNVTTAPSQSPKKSVTFRTTYFLIPAIILVLGYVIYAFVANTAYNMMSKTPTTVEQVQRVVDGHERIIRKFPMTSAAKKSKKNLYAYRQKLENFKLQETRARKAQQITYYVVFDTSRDTKDPFLNLRSSPSPQARILKKMKDGTMVIVLETGLGPKSKWWKVKIRDSNVVGYAHSRYLKVKR